jgi:hypothetical protein
VVLGNRLFPQSVNGVSEGHDRIYYEHSGADGPHYFSDFFPHGRFIAVYLTFAAGGFSFLERAVGKTMVGIAEQFAALFT